MFKGKERHLMKPNNGKLSLVAAWTLSYALQSSLQKLQDSSS